MIYQVLRWAAWCLVAGVAIEGRDVAGIASRLNETNIRAKWGLYSVGAFASLVVSVWLLYLRYAVAPLLLSGAMLLALLRILRPVRRAASAVTARDSRP